MTRDRKGTAELEIGLHRRDAGSYAVELRFISADSEADVRIAPSGKGVLLDLVELRSVAFDAEARGVLLGEALFRDPDLRAGLTQARASADAAGVPLRLRILVGPSAPELHAVNWETLIPPGDSSALATSERVLFSRYLSSSDWRPVKLRPQSEMTGLVVIANPDGLEDFSPGNVALAPVDVEGELARARSGLGGIPLTELASGGSATLDGIQAGLREGHDLLYLVAHGALVDGEPWLWLEDEHGKVRITEGDELIARLKELTRTPRLVILASCQSAGTGRAPGAAGPEAMNALGPRLAEAGVAAVVGMQGNITMETVSELMPAFFAELGEHGEVDRAMAVARGVVRERPDWWMPALFMRLKSGRISYAPGFGAGSSGMTKWPALLSNIKAGKCTPILGAGLTESLWGSRGDTARAWADGEGFPMDRAGRDQLPRVAQFLAVDQDPAYPTLQLADTLRAELLRRHSARLGWEDASAPTDELLREVLEWRRARGRLNPHEVLASLALPIYLTTQPDELLADALRAAGREPVVELCKWNQDLELLPSIYDDEPGYRPTPERPLIYHLFGRLEEPSSLVLTEDDHFEFLVGTTRNEELIPLAVRRTLADTALLLLGFQLDDWDFRVLFRSLVGQEGGRRRLRYAHVAAQVDPEQGKAEEPERAQSYLETRFKHSNFSIYWGNVDDFLGELGSQMGLELAPPKPLPSRREAGPSQQGGAVPAQQCEPPRSSSEKPTQRAPLVIDEPATAPATDRESTGLPVPAREEPAPPQGLPFQPGGLNGLTGKPLLPAMTAEEIARLSRGVVPDERSAQRMGGWNESRDSAHLGPIEGVDPKDLSQSGWAVVFAEGADPTIRAALQPLLDHRQSQAGELFKLCPDYKQGQDSFAWLIQQGASPVGSVNPSQVPYYILLIGDPSAIPFSFQYELDIQYAVGRLDLPTADDYARYAASVIAAETDGKHRAKDVALWSPTLQGDAATQWGTYLNQQLGYFMGQEHAGWGCSAVDGEGATKSQLCEYFGGESRPGLVFSTTHGVVFPMDPIAPANNGALVVAGKWHPGAGPITPDSYLTGDDLASELAVDGLISFQFACYSGGTPATSAFEVPEVGRNLAKSSFVADLSKRLLAHPRGGALAVIGHVDFAWGYSIAWADKSGKTTPNLTDFRSTLRRLLEGHPVGSAMEYFNQRHSQLGAYVARQQLQERNFGKKSDPDDVAMAWTTYCDARSYVVLGDPAVRLSVAT